MKDYSETDIQELKQKVYDSFHDISKIPILKKYIYDSQWLKTFIGDSNYLDLISLDFNAKSIVYDLSEILIKHIGLADFQQEKIINEIKTALNSKELLPDILTQFYDDYCHGYDFFEDLGLCYGLCCEVPNIDNKTYNSWEELLPEQKSRIIDGFFPQLDRDLKRALEWFVTGKIKFTEEYNDYNVLDYIDYRSDDEKKSKCF